MLGPVGFEGGTGGGYNEDTFYTCIENVKTK